MSVIDEINKLYSTKDFSKMKFDIYESVLDQKGKQKKKRRDVYTATKRSRGSSLSQSIKMK